MPRTAILIGLTLSSLLVGCWAPSEQATPDALNLPLLSVSKRAGFVFALAPDGLYRASLDTKKWGRLQTPPEMPLDGKFASQPGPSPLLLYVTLKSMFRPKDESSPPGLRYGLYLSRDNGVTWALASERDDFGATLLHPDGTIFAVAGCDGVNAGGVLLRSPDLGKTWKDITGQAFGQFLGIEPDSDHPGLVRIKAWAIRGYTFVAENENYDWKSFRGERPVTGKRPSQEFFARDSSSTNTFYMYDATLANYFGYDFGNARSAQALDIVPAKARFEFTRGTPVVVPVEVVFHWDQDEAMARWRQARAKGQKFPKPTDPIVKFAVQAKAMDFWGLRVETPEDQLVRDHPSHDLVTLSVESDAEGKVTSTRSQSPRVQYEIVELSAAKPYATKIDLGQLVAFSKPGEYRVQIVYSSGGSPDREKDEWDGSLTSPPFTVVIGK